MSFDSIPEDREQSFPCQNCGTGSVTLDAGKSHFVCSDCVWSAEAPKDWYFTFGCGQEHAGHYCIFHGTYSSARDKMVAKYGLKWSMQYGSAEDAGVARWNYKLLEKA